MDKEPSEPRGPLARELIDWRRKARLSQRDLVDLSGVSLATIRDIETGKQAKPKPETLRLIAKGLVTPVGGEPHDDDLWEAFYALMKAADYVYSVEPGPLYEARVTSETAKLQATLPGPEGTYQRSIDVLLMRLRHALASATPRDHLLMISLLHMVVEYFNPRDPVETDADVDELDDEVVPIPKLDVLFGRLFSEADKVQSTPGDPPMSSWNWISREEMHSLVTKEFGQEEADDVLKIWSEPAFSSRERDRILDFIRWQHRRSDQAQVENDAPRA